MATSGDNHCTIAKLEHTKLTPGAGQVAWDGLPCAYGKASALSPGWQHKNRPIQRMETVWKCMAGHGNIWNLILDILYQNSNSTWKYDRYVETGGLTQRIWSPPLVDECWSGVGNKFSSSAVARTKGPPHAIEYCYSFSVWIETRKLNKQVWS